MARVYQLLGLQVMRRVAPLVAALQMSLRQTVLVLLQGLHLVLLSLETEQLLGFLFALDRVVPHEVRIYLVHTLRFELVLAKYYADLEITLISLASRVLLGCRLPRRVDIVAREADVVEEQAGEDDANFVLPPDRAQLATYA